MQGGDRSKIWTCAIFFFWKERTSQDIGYVLPKYENGQIRRNQRRSDLEKNLPEASVIRWRVTVPYENKVLEELDIWDLQWLIFVLKPHKTSIAVDLVFFNLYLQICIIITTVRLKIKKRHSLYVLYMYLRAPLIMHATKSPGRPGRSWNTSITKCGKSWNTKTSSRSRCTLSHVSLWIILSHVYIKSREEKSYFFFTEMRKIRISWL